MASIMQPIEQFMDTNTDFHIVNLQVEKVLGECHCTTKPNAYHYYVGS